MERMLSARLSEHLGYEPDAEPANQQGNRRKGTLRIPDVWGHPFRLAPATGAGASPTPDLCDLVVVLRGSVLAAAG